MPSSLAVTAASASWEPGRAVDVPVRERVAAITSLEAPLIRRAQAGNSDAFGELYQRNERPVRNYLASRLGSGHAADIDDLVAETFLTAMQRISTFELDQPGRFGCWLVGIARNKLLNWYRRASSREIACDEPWNAAGTVDAAVEPVSPEDVVLERLEVADALSRLAPRTRRAMVLQHAVGLPAAEIALALGTTKRSVWGMTGRVRQELCEQVDPVVPTERPNRRPAAVAPVLCACGCGAELPAVRKHNRRYATARCRNRAAWLRRKAAQRRYLAGPVKADPAVERVLQLVQAAGSRALSRGELSRRTRFLAARLERAVGLLARRGLISVVLEPSEGRLVVRYRALAGAAARRAA